MTDDGRKRYRLSGNPKNDLSQYSDEELRKMINRKSLEKQYRDLEKTSFKKGLTYINQYMIPLATTTTTLITLSQNSNKIFNSVKKHFAKAMRN